MTAMHTKERHGLGWIPDIPKKADFRVKIMSKEEISKVSLPPAIELYTPPILDQKSTSSCCGFASASLYRYHLHQNFNEFQPSPLFNYWFGRHVPRLGWEDEDEGAMPRDVMQSMISNGVVREEDWPFSEDPKVVNQRPPQALLAKAKANKVLEGKYVRMLANDNLFHLKYSLAQGLPFLVGVDVYSSFFDTGDDGLVPIPQTNQTFEGGHLVWCNGFSDELQCFRCPNSWGTGWGDNGVAWIPYPYIANAGLAGDFWRIEAIT